MVCVLGHIYLIHCGAFLCEVILTYSAVVPACMLEIQAI